MSRVIPKLTHLQAAVLGQLAVRQAKGRILREYLGKLNVKQTYSAFYQMMSRLEENDYVKGKTTTKIIDSQIYKERMYSITDKGRESLLKVTNFYENIRQFTETE